MSINMMYYLAHFAGRLFISSLTRLEHTGMVLTLLFQSLLPIDGGRYSSLDTHTRRAFFVLGMPLVQIFMNNVSSICRLHQLRRPSILLIALSSSSIRIFAKIQSISSKCLVGAFKFVCLMKQLKS